MYRDSTRKAWVDLTRVGKQNAQNGDFVSTRWRFQSKMVILGLTLTEKRRFTRSVCKRAKDSFAGALRQAQGPLGMTVLDSTDKPWNDGEGGGEQAKEFGFSETPTKNKFRSRRRLRRR